MIEDLFKDCEKIAETYDEHLINVVVEFTRIEFGHKHQMTDVPYEILLSETEQHFKNKYQKSHVRNIYIGRNKDGTK